MTTMFTAPGAGTSTPGATFKHPPTVEQQVIIGAYATGANLLIEAGAGTGKTSTLRMLAAATPRRQGLYIAYNKAIADDAARSFGSNVDCRTAHSLAFQAVGRRYSHRLNGRRVPAREVARILDLRSEVIGGRHVTAAHLARITLDTVEQFCRSADAEIRTQHVPPVPGLDSVEAHLQLTAVVSSAAQAAWNDIYSLDGRLRFEHSHYLKIWSLTRPKLNANYVMLDEAQDANPVIASVVEQQLHAQRILVGDQSQAINGWNGAVDAMAAFHADHRLQLTRSFRFGQLVADEANRYLELLDAPLRLTGNPAIESTIGRWPGAGTVLCRTNGGTLAELMNAQTNGLRTALVGGGQDVRRLAEAAIELRTGNGCSHPELMAFKTWHELREYVQTESGGRDLKVFVELVDAHGPNRIIQAVDALVVDERGRPDEDAADLIVSTGHKAKGREWPSVRISSDFREPDEDDGPEREELMLGYVASTRARHHLDRGGLAWISQWGTR